MTLKIAELISVLLSAVVGGMYWGPWLALTRSMRTFEPDVFLAIVNRMNRNMESVMTVLTPVALLSVVPVLALSYHVQLKTFYLALAAVACFLVALLVTMLVEVPIVKRIVTWTPETLPRDWHQLRDRWGAFHLVRVVMGIAGLGLLTAGAIL